jgi:mono/diheme cytochrome c family protein
MSPTDLPQGRETDEPEDLPNGIPWVVGAVILLVVAWGVWTFVDEIDAGLGPYGDGRTRAALAPAVLEPRGEGPPDGAAAYAARCAACHQADGNGLAGVFPPLAGSRWVVGDAERPVAIVLHGLQGPIEVRGSTYSSVMPALGGQIPDAEIAAILTHVRSSFGNDAPAVETAVVAKVREELGERGSIGGQAELETLFGE